jgi:type I restriction enzyme M protein
MDKEKFYSISNETYTKYKSNKIKKDDVLVSMTGTIGNVAIYSINEPAIINQNIVKLTCNLSIINPLVLALYIKVIGKDLLVRQQTGNVQPYVNISNFSNLIVPLINKDVQNKIIDLLNQSNNLRQRSKELLEIAKKGVEKAIETDEETAIKWINEELEKMGVSIR